jgi:hypothetical protein
VVAHLRDSTGSPHSILTEVVHTYMNESGEEDIMRAFFRTQVGNIGEILPPVLAIAERHSRGLGRDTSTAIPEASRIILVCSFCVFVEALFTFLADRTQIGLGIPGSSHAYLWCRTSYD